MFRSRFTLVLLRAYTFSGILSSFDLSVYQSQTILVKIGFIHTVPTPWVVLSRPQIFGIAGKLGSKKSLFLAGLKGLKSPFVRFPILQDLGLFGRSFDSSTVKLHPSSFLHSERWRFYFFPVVPGHSLYSLRSCSQLLVQKVFHSHCSRWALKMRSHLTDACM